MLSTSHWSSLLLIIVIIKPVLNAFFVLVTFPLQASPDDMDVSVLMAVQSLVESVKSHEGLLTQLYQYLLFDFRLWMNSQNHVRIGELLTLECELPFFSLTSLYA